MAIQQANLTFVCSRVVLADVLQVSFVSMKFVLFVGGYPKDKTIFALVHEDASKVLYLGVFQYREPVGGYQMLWMLMTCSRSGSCRGSRRRS